MWLTADEEKGLGHLAASRAPAEWALSRHAAEILACARDGVLPSPHAISWFLALREERAYRALGVWVAMCDSMKHEGDADTGEQSTAKLVELNPDNAWAVREFVGPWRQMYDAVRFAISYPGPESTAALQRAYRETEAEIKKRAERLDALTIGNGCVR